jgi:hypothetical protein
MSSPNKGLPKNKFSPDEDAYLKRVVEDFGCQDWSEVASYFPGRNPRQCRERWNNYVNPRFMKLPWTPMDDALLDQKYAEFGPKWHVLVQFFPNRSKNYVKNRWLTKQRHIRKHDEVDETTIEPQPDPVPVPPPELPLTKLAVGSNDDHPEGQARSFIGEPFFMNQEDIDNLWNLFDCKFV